MDKTISATQITSRTQTRILELITSLSRREAKKQIDLEIERAIKQMGIESMISDARASLRAYARRQMRRYYALDVALAASVFAAQGKDRGLMPLTVKLSASFTTTDAGMPSGIYGRDYMRKVDRVLKSMLDDKPIDTGDVSGRNSLRNRAEMETRYLAHQDAIAELKSSEEKLVVVSVHADCSERCKDFQGKVYSLDGTSGVTDDGREYEPLERATDVYYTTKAGKTYKNGLLGFNCRHKLCPYKAGMAAPHVDETERKRAYDVTRKQREYERSILRAKEEATLYKNIDVAKSRGASARMRNLKREYTAFSKDNERAFYPERLIERPTRRV